MCVVQQPIFMVLVNPGPLGHFEGSRPNSHLQSQSANAVSKIPHAIGKLRGIGCRVFAARVSVTLVKMKIVVAKCLQVFSQPLSVRERSACGDLCVEGRPTPPSEHIVRANTTVTQLSNHGAIVLKLRVVAGSNSKHQAFRSYRFARWKRNV